MHNTTLRVRYAETDQMGFVYHAHYLVWCEIGRTDHIRSLGISYAELERRGWLLAVSDAQVRFHSPARYDDLVRVDTKLVRVRSRVISFAYEILRTEPAPVRRLVSASTNLVALGTDSTPRSLAPELLTLFRDAVEHPER